MSQGNGRSSILTFSQAPNRVVSLVPSVTDSLIELKLADHLVGVTDFCRVPEDLSQNLARVGGTRRPRLESVLELEPDLVIANMEENSKEAVEAMERAGLQVWVTFPRSVAEALELLWALAGLFRCPDCAPKIKTLEISLEWTARAAAEHAPIRLFCPIWLEEANASEPWLMTFNRRTYAHDVLAHCGGENIFADRERRYPLEADLGTAAAEDAGGRDTRYPRVTLAEIRERGPEVILLPSEPFSFTERHREAMCEWLADTPAVHAGRVHLLDGSLITWHGTRLGHALVELPALFEYA